MNHPLHPAPAQPAQGFPIATLAALLTVLCAGNPSAYAQGLTLANPDWNITLTDSGYSDFLLDNTPGFEGREYLSGEWGAAVGYQVGGNTPTPPQWFEPQFLYPDWTTGSTFHVVTPITQTGLNADGLPIAQSVIANDALQVTLRHEMLDTVVGTPMGITPASAGGSGASIRSSRYVLKQTCTLNNISGTTLSSIQLFQFLHGLHSQRGVLDNRPHSGPLSSFQYDLTLAGVDPWAVGTGSSTAGLEDFIGFHASMAPSAFEVGHYGVEGNGVDDHWSGKPSDGVHLSVENNWQASPYNIRQGTDSFAPPQLWVGGAQRWNLGSLAAGQSTSLDILLTVRTGTIVDRGTSSSGGCNGGSGVPGGLDYDFDDVPESGSCFADYSQADTSEREVRIADGEFAALTFPLPSEPAQVWTLVFTGTFTGNVHLTVGYDPSILPGGFDETALCLYQFDGNTWQQLPGTVDTAANTIRITTTSLAPLALGSQSLSQHTVAASVLPEGSGTILGTGTFASGSLVPLTALPTTGYVFSHWSENGSLLSTSPSFTLGVSADHTLTAHFVPTGGDESITTSSLPAIGGSTTGDGAYSLGSVATVVATPAQGYKFSKWREGDTEVSTSASYSFTVTGPRTLVAKFKPVYSLTLSPEPADAGEVEGDPLYEIGEVAKLKAKPNSGYAFVNWTQNGLPISTDPNFQFAMTGNRELVGHFAPGQRIDISSVPPHAGTTTGAGVHPTGSSVSVEATPEPGYEFVHWTENDTPVSTDPTYTFTSSTSRSLVANFQLATGDLSAPIAGNDTAQRLPNRALKIRASSLLANDSSPDALPLNIVAVEATSSNGGQVALEGDWILFEPAPDSNATDSFLYTLSDGTQQAPGMVTVLLAPAPEAIPLNITASFLITVSGSDQMHVRANGIPGRTYVLQSASSLVAPVSWSDLGDPVPANTLGEAEFIDPTPASPRFYRVIEAAP